MSLKMLDSTSVSRSIKRLSIMDETDTLQTLEQLSIQDETNALQPVFSGMTVAASPDTLSATISTPFPSDAQTSNPSIATPTGGVAPYTYAWSLTDSLGSWNIDTSSSASSYMTAVNLAPGADANASMQCMVTDSIGSTALSNVVSASAFNSG